jgi:hypothetical protein
MPFIDKTKSLGQTQATQTLAPTPNTKEQMPTQHSNPRTQTTPQQQKQQHSNLPSRPHTYGTHQLFLMEGDQNDKTDYKIISTTTDRAHSDFEKANTFAEHLANMFQPHPSENSPVQEEVYLPTSYKPLTNLTLPSTISCDLKSCGCQKNSIHHLATTLSWEKSFKNYL